MADSTIRRPLITVGVTIMVALVVLLSAFTLLARGTFTSSRITDTLPSGWVAVGVRAPASAGGVLALLPVGGPTVSLQSLENKAAADAIARNDPNGLSQVIADATSRPMAGAVVLDRLALAALVDVVGGVRVDVRAAFTWSSTGSEGGTVQPGPQTLRGIAAATYALSEPSGAALRDVLAPLLHALPTEHHALIGIVRSLGMSMRATVSAATVVRWVEFWQSRL